jgi:hypothetical protein
MISYPDLEIKEGVMTFEVVFIEVSKFSRVVIILEERVCPILAFKIALIYLQSY